jgi:hypothetical protein
MDDDEELEALRRLDAELREKGAGPPTLEELRIMLKIDDEGETLREIVDRFERETAESDDG